MRSILAGLLCGLVAAGLPIVTSAQPNQPKVKEESNADHYQYEYEDGACHYHYEYNWRDQHEHVDQQGDCGGITLPRQPPPR